MRITQPAPGAQRRPGGSRRRHRERRAGRVNDAAHQLGLTLIEQLPAECHLRFGLASPGFAALTGLSSFAVAVPRVMSSYCRVAALLRVVGVDKWSIGSAGTGIYGEAAVDGEVRGGGHKGRRHTRTSRDARQTRQAHKTELKAESGRETHNDAKRQSRGKQNTGGAVYCAANEGKRERNAHGA